MPRLCAQGDILVERVDVDGSADARAARVGSCGSVVIAEGEVSGHRHSLLGAVAMYRDDALARDIPHGLYLTHVRIHSATARLEHQEHGVIILPQGTYRFRRQRQLELSDDGGPHDRVVED